MTGSLIGCFEFRNYTGLSTIIDVLYLRLRAIQRPQIQCNPVHVALHFKLFYLMILKWILASKLSELEQFKIFFSKQSVRKQTRVKMMPNQTDAIANHKKYVCWWGD